MKEPKKGKLLRIDSRPELGEKWWQMGKKAMPEKRNQGQEQGQGGRGGGERGQGGRGDVGRGEAGSGEGGRGQKFLF